MTRREFCEYFEIPYRTLQDWELGNRKMPEYLLRLMEYKMKMEGLTKQKDSSSKDEVQQKKALDNITFQENSRWKKNEIILFETENKEIKLSVPVESPCGTRQQPVRTEGGDTERKNKPDHFATNREDNLYESVKGVFTRPKLIQLKSEKSKTSNTTLSECKAGQGTPERPLFS